METGDTARSGTLSRTPPEYGATATDFLNQLAPPGFQLLEPHDHHLVTTVSSQISLSVLRIPFGGFFLVLCRDRHVRQVNFDTGCRSVECVYASDDFAGRGAEVPGSDRPSGATRQQPLEPDTFHYFPVLRLSLIHI